jgi:hypothetical protein
MSIGAVCPKESE